MKFRLLEGGDYGEHNGVGFAVISIIFAMHVSFFFEMTSFYRDYIYSGVCSLVHQGKTRIPSNSFSPLIPPEKLRVNYSFYCMQVV